MSKYGVKQAFPGASTLPVPSSENFSKYSDLAQVKVHKYFNRYKPHPRDDIYKIDYIKKTFDIMFTDFVAFMETVSQLEKKVTISLSHQHI